MDNPLSDASIQAGALNGYDTFMSHLVQEFVDSFDRGDAVLTMLVETRGSTPQKAGAMMLVFRDGSQRGTLGGGCVEAEVKRQALGLMASQQSKLLTFQLDHDYGWDDGLICGGRMTMLVQPALTDEVRGFYSRLAELVTRGEGATLAVSLNAPTDQDVPLALFGPGGEQFAQLGEMPSPLSVRPIRERPRPNQVDGVSFLPFLPRCRLVIVGAGHVGQKVAQLAAESDFEVTVVDDRADYCRPERLPGASECIVGPIEEVLDGIPIDHHTYCLIVTRGHHHDEQALFRLIDRGAAFVGMIGSKRKIRLIFDDLRRDGVSEELLSRVQAPVGLDIGSQTVPEIAISIVGQLIERRNRPRREIPTMSPRTGGETLQETAAKTR